MVVVVGFTVSVDLFSSLVVLNSLTVVVVVLVVGIASFLVFGPNVIFGISVGSFFLCCSIFSKIRSEKAEVTALGSLSTISMISSTVFFFSFRESNSNRSENDTAASLVSVINMSKIFSFISSLSSISKSSLSDGISIILSSSTASRGTPKSISCSTTAFLSSFGNSR